MRELVMQSLKDRHREDGTRDTEVQWRCDGSSAEMGKTSGLISKRDCEGTIAENGGSKVQIFEMQSLKDRCREESEQETEVERSGDGSL